MVLGIRSPRSSRCETLVSATATLLLFVLLFISFSRILQLDGSLKRIFLRDHLLVDVFIPFLAAAAREDDVPVMIEASVLPFFKLDAVELPFRSHSTYESQECTASTAAYTHWTAGKEEEQHNKAYIADLTRFIPLVK